MDKADWCFASTGLQLHTRNYNWWNRTVIVAGSVAYVKIATAAVPARWVHEKYANACGHTNDEVKIDKIKEEKKFVTLSFMPPDARQCWANKYNVLPLTWEMWGVQADETTSQRWFWFSNLNLESKLFWGIRNTKTTRNANKQTGPLSSSLSRDICFGCVCCLSRIKFALFWKRCWAASTTTQRPSTLKNKTKIENLDCGCVHSWVCFCRLDNNK